MFFQSLHPHIRVLLLAPALLLGACSRQDAAPDAAALERARQRMPADPALAAVYERSCRSCHAESAAQAPLSGFAPHWQARLAQGMPTVLQHVHEGLRGMPARGYCNDCSDQDFEALVRFMSQPDSP
ncbi:MAG: c-type cytochrome [Rhodoferax sp.]